MTRDVSSSSPHDPILVSGAPRSGSTWVGRTLATARVRYVHEPFNISAPPCSCGVRLERWFTYVVDEDDAPFRRHIAHALGSPFGRYNLLNALPGNGMPLQGTLKHLRRCLESAYRRRVLIKDPLALLSSEWLARSFDMRVILVVRHPAGLVASYKRLDWRHPFSHFLEQPALMRDHLGAFVDEITEHTRDKLDLVDQAALLWKILYATVAKFRDAHPDWVIVRYEDLCAEPTRAFRALSDAVGLTGTGSGDHPSSKRRAPSGAPNSPYALDRDSRGAADRWKKELTADEVRRVRESVEPISSLYYDDSEWR